MRHGFVSRHGFASRRGNALGQGLLLALFVIMLVPASSVWAQGQGGYAPYVPAAASPEHAAALFVVLAYSAIWLVLLLFVASVWRRERRLEAEIARLRLELEREH